MVLFYDRRLDAHKDLTANTAIQYVTGIVGENPPYSGGEYPPMSQTKEKYPLDQTTSVTNVR
jgi:hypothetical protein